MSNTPDRITDRRKLNNAAKLLSEVISLKGTRHTARLLKINPGTVAYIVGKQDTHFTLTPILYAQIELLHTIVMHGSELSNEAMEQADRALQLQGELAQALRKLRKTIRQM